MDRKQFMTTLGVAPVVALTSKVKIIESKVIFMIVDPFMISMGDLMLMGKKVPGLKGCPVIRYKANQWGADHPAIQLYTTNDVKNLDKIEDLMKELG